MAELRFYISGSIVGTVQADVVPSPGAEVTFTMDSYKKGQWPGTILAFIVEGADCQPTSYDYSGNQVVAHIDVNSYTILKDGPELEER